eukprot:gene6790-30755_t
MRSFAVISALLLLLASPLASGAPFRHDGDCIDPALLESGLTAFPENMRLIGSQGSSERPSKVDLAIGFTVEYKNSYKIVNNTATSEVYVLYQCGSVAPSAEEVPEGAKVFAIPLAGVSVPDSTALAFLEALGLGGRIDFVTQYAVNPCMQSLGIGGCNKIALYIPYGLGNAYYDIAAGEEIQAAFDAQYAEVDAFFVYGASASDKGISVVASPYFGMLQRAEWIKYVSVFFNLEPEANAIFQGLEQRYATIKTAASISSTKPLVAFVSYTPPQWGEAISVSFADYKLNLIDDAGGLPLDKAAIAATFPDVTFQYFSFELNNMSTAPAILKSMLANVDVVVDESFYQDIKNADLSMADFMERYGFTADDVASFDGMETPAGYTAWFEAAVTNPDGVLLNLYRGARYYHESPRFSAATGPPELGPGGPLSYYHDSPRFSAATGPPELGPGGPLLPRLTPLLCCNPNSNPQALANIDANVLAGTRSGFLRVLGRSEPTLLVAQQCPLASCVIPSSKICPFIYKACDGSVNHADELVSALTRLGSDLHRPGGLMRVTFLFPSFISPSKSTGRSLKRTSSTPEGPRRGRCPSRGHGSTRRCWSSR